MPFQVVAVYKEILPLLMIALMFAIAVYAGPMVNAGQADQMMIHWGIDGKPDGWGSTAAGLYLLPVFTLIIYAALLVIPKIEVYQHNLEDFAQQFWGFKVIFVFVMGVIYVATLLPNLNYGRGTDPSMIIVPAIAMLFFYVGHMLNFTKRNYFIGIRTPWTLADEKVWEKTNRLGAKLFWVCGALTLVSLVAQDDLRLWLILLPLILGSIGASIYSLVEYRKTKHKNNSKRKGKE